MPRSRSRSRSRERRRRSASPSTSGSSSLERSRHHRDKSSKKHKKDRKHHKDDKKHHKKHKKRSRSASPDAAARRLVKEAKKFLKQKLKEADAAAGACTLPPPPPLPAFPAPGDPLLPPDAQVTPLTGDDYFAKAGEFAAWADEARRLAVADLATGDARALFLEFVAAWNARALPARFYDGRAAAPTRRTAHNWGIKGRGGGEGVAGGSGGVTAADGRKAWRRDQNDLLDELLPKATGREAMQEARAGRREAAVARDASPDVARLPGGGADVMGGGDTYAAALAAEAARAAARGRKAAGRGSALAVRAAAAAQAEAEKMAAFRALVAGGPITIPKRAPPPPE